MKYLICYIENITKHVSQKLLKAVTMAVLLSLLAAGLLPAGTVSAEESASFSWYNPETGYDILIEDDAALLTTEEKNLLADTMAMWPSKALTIIHSQPPPTPVPISTKHLAAAW